jgi:isoquinoline 1-oxidoreductase subunit alpha
MEKRTVAAITLTVNGQEQTLDADAEMPLLWALRDILGLTGTKFGCGMGLCGACTVHVDGAAVHACQTPLRGVDGRSVTTIEGLGAGAQASTAGLHSLQRAWIAEDVPQCGYCQSGQIMAAAALLAERPRPTDAEIDSAMAGNICRCGTYGRIRRAIRRASQEGEA